MGRMGVTAAWALLATIGASGQMRQPSQAPPTAKSEAEKRILAVLEQARASGDVYLEVPVVDGRMLRVLTEGANAKQVVEFGTSTGYSGLWLCLALQGTGGKLMTFELDAGRAARARKHFEQAGVEKMVTVVEGDAHANVGQIKGPVDVVFIDAEKQGYVEYLKAVLPLVRPGGYILAHNIEMVPDYVKAVTTDPNLETVFFMSGNGLGITLKKR
jgi:caffeoyl-CoA O-methyltransferase